MTIEAFGVRLGIRMNVPEAPESLTGYLPPGWQAVSGSEPVVDHLCSLIIGGDKSGRGARPGRGVKTYNILYSGSWRAVRTLDREEALNTLARVLDFQVALQAPRHVFVHAGVVGWPGRGPCVGCEPGAGGEPGREQAVLIPGRSLSGKTTLVRALVEAGAVYYSDEYAALDENGMVHPYPRPLNIRAKRDSPGRPTPIEEIGGRAGTAPLPVGGIIDTAYEPGALWEPQPLSPVESALCLLNNTLIAKLDPRRALPVLRKAVLGARGMRSPRGEASGAADQLLSVIRNPYP